MSSDNEA